MGESRGLGPKLVSLGEMGYEVFGMWGGWLVWMVLAHARLRFLLAVAGRWKGWERRMGMCRGGHA